MAAVVKVIFQGDDRGAVRTARAVQREIGGVGGASRRALPFLKSLGTIAAVGVGAAFAGLAATLKVGFDELSEGQKVAAQTGAVLKSTGGIANVTARDVGELAGSLSRLTGIDDEAIQAGENLLLTFKNIRNEVGAGNDIFNQAAESALNLSTAGFGSLESTSKQLGKALNDPIKGMTALGRAGVTFSEDQKKAIEKFVESNDLLSAQKLILAEVESQVGGSAKAYGETLPGQLSKLRNSFEEVAGSIAQTLLPYLTRLLDWTNDHMPQIKRVIETTLDAVIATIDFLVPIIGRLIDWFRRLAEAARRNWGEVRAAAESVANWYRSNLEPTITSVTRNISRAWERMGEDTKASVRGHLTSLPPIVEAQIRNIISVLNIGLAILRGDWSTAWAEIKAIVTRTFSAIKETIVTLAGTAFNLARRVGEAIIHGIADGFTGLLGLLKEKVESGLKSIVSTLSPFSSVEHGGYLYIGKPLAEGAILGWIDGSKPLPEKMKEKVREAVEAARSAVEERRGVFAQAFQALTGEALSAFDKLASEIETRSEKQLRVMEERRSAAERKRSIREARGALAEARAGLEGLTADEGETPEDFARRQAEAQAQITEAQRRLDDALYAQRRAQLERQAEAERRNLNDRLALRRRHFEEDLDALGRYAERHALTAEQLNQRLLKIFAKYQVPFKEATTQLGLALAEGLRDTINEVERAAVAVRNEILKHLSNLSFRVSIDVVVPDKPDRDSPKGRQHGGRVWPWEDYLVGEGGPEILRMGSGSGYVLPNSALRSLRPAAAMGGGGGGFSLHLHVVGDFIGERAWVDALAYRLKPALESVVSYPNKI